MADQDESVEPSRADLLDRIADCEETLVDDVQARFEDYEADLAEYEAQIEEYEDQLATYEADIEDLNAEVDELKGRLKRKQADFENYKKRQQREQDRIRRRAVETLLERLLEVRDNLQRALDEQHEDVDSLRDGIRMTMQEFDRVLDAEGVSKITPEPGADVDPTRHEVMMRVDAATPEGTVADVYRTGYETEDSVLRPAQVTVSTGAEHEPTEAMTDDPSSSPSEPDNQ